MNQSIGSGAPPRVAICITSYKRPDLLGDLLASLTRELEVDPGDAEVIVVDNDPAGSARGVVARSRIVDVYEVEVEPGIAAGRNRCLELVSGDRTWIAFLDDDERVRPGWYAAMSQYVTTTEADVVSGPVVSVFEAEVPRWVVKGGFLQRDRHPTGPFEHIPATNNTWVRATLITDSRRFPESFSQTGGSDSAFFWDLRNEGAKFDWCDEAVVEESVPAERTTLRWIWLRGTRNGQVLARLMARDRSRIRIAVGGVLRIVKGALLLVWDLVRMKGVTSRGIAGLSRGTGFLQALSGRLHYEYARNPERGAAR